MFDFSHFTQILLKSSIFLDKTMKADGHILGTAGPILLIFHQIGANNINFSKSHMRAGTRYFFVGLGFTTCKFAIMGPIRVPFLVAKIR